MQKVRAAPHRFARRLLCLGLILVAAGCGSSRRGLVEVSGIVTLDGAPVTSGKIEFYPPSGRPSAGEIDGEGRYRLTTYEPGDGVLPGEYKVTITSVLTPDDGPVYKSFEDELNGVTANANKSGSSRPKKAGAQWIVPQKYSNRASTDLTAEVVPGGGEINFALESKP
ncbi:hypothetical protein Pla175_26370 [Pirellulimonas nuda]|uniref:Carboxypeptidase regulatory-like domain-containing protein n=1 Tax=Pirellulimonas nuda TaxID=2528009 RepID=A0A518DCR4_9BACT|nr:hypothetical protein [Pirellulimonas nuda]QDU89250.1 hypothetical protein Pla175_26370 [Pirellulimonas nuda]